MKKEYARPEFSEYDFLELLTAITLIDGHGYVINKSELEKKLVNYYDNEKYHFLFEDVIIKEDDDNKHLDLGWAFFVALVAGLLVLIRDNSKEQKYVIKITEKDAYDILSRCKGNETIIMSQLLKEMNKKPDHHKLLEHMNEHMEYLKLMAKENPEEAKKMATESLKDAGILDENGNINVPYNGEVNDDDFTRGPKLTREKKNQNKN